MNITKSIERINTQQDVERDHPYAVIQRLLISAYVAKNTPGRGWAMLQYLEKAEEIMRSNGIPQSDIDINPDSSPWLAR